MPHLIKRAFITILMESDPAIYSHVLTNVNVFVWALVHRCKVKVPVAVAVTREVPQVHRATLANMGAQVIEVDKVTVQDTSSVKDTRRRDQLTKIHLCANMFHSNSR